MFMSDCFDRSQSKLNELKEEWQQLKTETELLERSLFQQEKKLSKCHEILKDSEAKKQEMKAKLENLLSSNQQRSNEMDRKARHGMSPAKKGKFANALSSSLFQDYKRNDAELQEKLRQEELSLSALKMELEDQKLQLKEKLAVILQSLVCFLI